MRSILLKKEKGGRFPDLMEDLEHFAKAFDHEKAKKDGVIIPEKGVDDDYDECCEKIKGIEAKLESYLKEQRKILHCSVKFAVS